MEAPSPPRRIGHRGVKQISPAWQMLSEYHCIRPPLRFVQPLVGLQFSTNGPPIADLHPSLSERRNRGFALVDADGA